MLSNNICQNYTNQNNIRDYGHDRTSEKTSVGDSILTEALTKQIKIIFAIMIIPISNHIANWIHL